MQRTLEFECAGFETGLAVKQVMVILADNRNDGRASYLDQSRRLSCVARNIECLHCTAR